MKSPLIHLVISLIVVLCVGSGYAFWYVAVSHKSAEVASLEVQITEATNNVKHIAVARAALDEISGDESKIQGYFVAEPDVVDFITDLQARGTENKASIEVVSVTQMKGASRPQLQFTLTVKGTFDAVMKTVGAIEYAPYDISIGGLSVVQTDPKAWQASVILTVGSVTPAKAPPIPSTK